MIGVIDYGAGNLRSVCNSLKKLSVNSTLIRSPEDIKDISSIIFPGVGSFGDSSEQLKKQRLFDPIKSWLKEDRPFLGICIGFQMLFEKSDESPNSDGFGIIPGKVVRFPEENLLKVPHMGWNEIKFENSSDPIWQGIKTSTHFYFVHSYYPEPLESNSVSSITSYGLEFASSVRCGNIFGTQFHPEKSQAAGLKLISNFLELT
ncbi:imidazole glycerol phosphate synthase subunit HisH [bacterium]|nr:imidazole glycerol phosphate synthase subunit HisH [bacterium]|tara:strand:- start:781 stop:1392 length:612 start_codon:yes stop_codon:yes gene_type:complete